VGYVFAMEHAPSHFNQSSIEPLYNIIGLRVIWCNELLLNAFHFVMILESFTNELTTVVTSNGLDLPSRTSLHHGLELFENYQSFYFCFKKKIHIILGCHS
jgi:hypothetical protein